MADEVDLTLNLPGGETANHAAWRSNPPAWLTDAGYALVDESYESLVYQADVMSRGMKILMWGQARTVYRITATFRPGGPGGTQFTLLGQAQEPVRAALLAWADQQAATSG